MHLAERERVGMFYIPCGSGSYATNKLSRLTRCLLIVGGDNNSTQFVSHSLCRFVFKLGPSTVPSDEHLNSDEIKKTHTVHPLPCKCTTTPRGLASCEGARVFGTYMSKPHFPVAPVCMVVLILSTSPRFRIRRSAATVIKKKEACIIWPTTRTRMSITVRIFGLSRHAREEIQNL